MTGSNINKLYKQRMMELAKMTERVDKVEKLLAANLESLDIQQKSHDTLVEGLTKSNKDKQTALDAFEKNKSRDKMIIKFREQRIAELEKKISKAKETQSNDFSLSNLKDTSVDESQYEALSQENASLQQQLDQLKLDNQKLQELATNNPQAAKLFAEKSELNRQKQMLQDELKVTPESLTARIRGLNDLTNDLNAYLKEYCMTEDIDTLRKELESTKQELGTKV